MKQYYSKDEIRFIKENVDIRDVMFHFNQEMDKYNRYICPNPEHNDTRPSAIYSNEAGKDKNIKNCLVCFSCPRLDGRPEIIDNIMAYSWLSGLDIKNDFQQICDELLNLEHIERKEIKLIKTNKK